MASLWSHSNSGVLWLNSDKPVHQQLYMWSIYVAITVGQLEKIGIKMEKKNVHIVCAINWPYKHVAKRVWMYFHYPVTLCSESSKPRHQAHIIAHRHLPNRQLSNSQICLRISIRSAVIFLLHRIQFLFMHSWVLLLSCWGRMCQLSSWILVREADILFTTKTFVFTIKNVHSSCAKPSTFIDRFLFWIYTSRGVHLEYASE